MRGRAGRFRIPFERKTPGEGATVNSKDKGAASSTVRRVYSTMYHGVGQRGCCGMNPSGGRERTSRGGFICGLNVLIWDCNKP